MSEINSDYFVYILKSLKDGRYYIGSTPDVQKRLIQHNLGYTKSTRNRAPFVLIYSEKLPNKHDALIRERKIKSYKGGAAFEKLITTGVPPLAG